METLKFELTVDEVNIVLGGLGELPAKTSLGLIQKLQQQAAAQSQPAAQNQAPDEASDS